MQKKQRRGLATEPRAYNRGIIFCPAAFIGQRLCFACHQCKRLTWEGVAGVSSTSAAAGPWYPPPPTSRTSRTPRPPVAAVAIVVRMSIAARLQVSGVLRSSVEGGVDIAVGEAPPRWLICCVEGPAHTLVHTHTQFQLQRSHSGGDSRETHPSHRLLSSGMLGSYHVEIVDHVRVPAGIPPGRYVLGWR